MTENVDEKVAEGFGDEWSRFDQTEFLSKELEIMLQPFQHTKTFKEYTLKD